MPRTYLIPIEEQNLDLIEFLNDGVRLRIEEKKAFFVCTITSQREIATKIEFEDDLYDENGCWKNPEHVEFVNMVSA